MRISDWSSDVCSSDLSAGLTLSGDAPEELITRAIPVFLEHYADNICTFSAPYPGLELALEELRIEGFRLAICTNKPEELANHLVEALGWAGMFDAIIGGDPLPVRKPDPRPLLTARSDAHTSELQSLMRNSYAVFCLL